MIRNQPYNSTCGIERADLSETCFKGVSEGVWNTCTKYFWRFAKVSRTRSNRISKMLLRKPRPSPLCFLIDIFPHANLQITALIKIFEIKMIRATIKKCHKVIIWKSHHKQLINGACATIIFPTIRYGIFPGTSHSSLYLHSLTQLSCRNSRGIKTPSHS